MNEVIKHIRIDLYNPKVYEVIKAEQGDDKSRCVEFELYDQGNPYEITNDTIANVEGLRADGSGYIKSCEINNNIITFVLDDNLLYYDGVAKLKLVLYSDNKKVLSSIPFKVSIERNPMFNIKFKKDEYSLINDVLNMVGEMDSKVSYTDKSIADINDNLSSEISRAKEADEILKSRVDVITSLPEGSTTGDAELQDIRVKADGTTATSAGNAVREQISELKSDLNDIDCWITKDLYTSKEITGSAVYGTGMVQITDGYFTGYATQSYWRYRELSGEDLECKKYILGFTRASNTDVNHVYFIGADNKVLLIAEKGSVEEIASVDYYAPKGTTKIVVESFYGTPRISIYENKLSPAIDSIIDNIGEIPSYYENHILSKEYTINNKNLETRNHESFIFVTDYHVKDNANTSIKLIKHIIENSSIKNVVFGGDVPSAFGTEGDLFGQANTFRRLVKKYLTPIANVYCVHGNHDFMINDSGTKILKGDSWEYDYLPLPSSVDTKRLYYSVDVKSSKTRYIILDTFSTVSSNDYLPYVTREQINWLLEALNVEEGWRVVVFGHCSINPNVSGYYDNMLNVRNILKAYKNKTICNSTVNNITVNHDFSSYNGTLVGYICGHNHKDENSTEDGVLTISTTSDAMYSDGGYERVKGTYSECAFDVFIINYDENKITSVRVGAGNNRNLTFVY